MTKVLDILLTIVTAFALLGFIAMITIIPWALGIAQIFGSIFG